MEPTIIGVAGGTASGKSTIVRELKKYFQDDLVAILYDNYYKAHDELDYSKRKNLNYDHPSSFETERLIRDLQALQRGESIEMPLYDYSIHNRSKKTLRLEPRPIILIEGILILENKELRDMCQIKVFVDADADVRLLRRILRDTKERDRDVDSVLEQYMMTVKPMHESFVEPTKKYADIIVPNGGHNKIALEMLIRHLESMI
ncbi:MAG: uridine kinase [Tissierellia bacterium]|nr:uridine kinase [Tissierellia bacterium]